ncbi:unnamed protein product [Ilex paraguariensis]|uniref:POTRA domain-containing protein n=1 Tax=Ilex paraguariensis TaxID=185542 RepID=A0ABC8RP64_9AQUA
MSENDGVRFVSSSIKLAPLSPLHHHPIPLFHTLQLSPQSLTSALSNAKHSIDNFITSLNVPQKSNPFNPRNAINQFVDSLKTHYKTNRFNPLDQFVNFFKTQRKNNPFHLVSRSSLLCSASLSLTQSEGDNAVVTQPKSGSGHSSTSRHEEERVLISEVLVRNKDGEELERKDLMNEALAALKASRPNSALTVREVQDDVHRIIASGYFCSCMPVAVDTRDGIRLVFQVEPNQEFRGLVCEGANVLPSKFIEDAFRDGYGKIVNIKRLDEVINSINDWYMERGLFGTVSGIEILSGGIIRLQVSEAEINNISIRFLDKTGEPTVGKTRPETILRQLTTKKGQVYSMLQGKRDVDTVLTMGIMEDVSIVPQPAGETGKVDLTMNVVQRESKGFSAGGGISSGITGGPLAGLIGSFAFYHRNLFGRNQKLNLSLERGQIDSIFRINYTDPWIEGDDKRTSRSIMVQNSRTPGTLVHGNQPDNSSLTIGRITAGIEYSRPFRPKWNGTAGVIFQLRCYHRLLHFSMRGLFGFSSPPPWDIGRVRLQDYAVDSSSIAHVQSSQHSPISIALQLDCLPFQSYTAFQWSLLSLIIPPNPASPEHPHALIHYKHVGARDDKGNPVIRDFYSSPLTASGNTHDDMLLAKLEGVYTGSGDPGSSMFVFNIEQGLPVWSEWLVFNRVSARARKGFVIGPARFHLSVSGGHVAGNFPPHEAFAIGGTNSVRGYEEGAVGSGRSYVAGCGEISFPLVGPVEGATFVDYGTDLGSGPVVPGDPAGARLKPGSGYGYGIGIRVDSPLGPLRLEYAFNDQRTGRFHFGVGLRN